MRDRWHVAALVLAAACEMTDVMFIKVSENVPSCIGVAATCGANDSDSCCTSPRSAEARCIAAAMTWAAIATVST